MQLILKQLAEKIDKIRQIAGNQIQDILTYCPKIEIPEKELLYKIFVEPPIAEWKLTHKDSKEEMMGPYYMSWWVADYTYQAIIPLIDSDIYGDSVLEGWIISAGGLTESTLKSSSNTLMQYIAKVDEKRKVRLLSMLACVFKRNKKVDRVLVPLIVSIDLLYQGNYMASPSLAECAASIIQFLKEESKTKNIVKVKIIQQIL